MKRTYDVVAAMMVDIIFTVDAEDMDEAEDMAFEIAKKLKFKDSLPVLSDKIKTEWPPLDCWEWIRL